MQWVLLTRFLCSIAMGTDFLVLIQSVVSRGEFGVLGPENDCWPLMACKVPSAGDEVLNDYGYILVLLLL